MLLRVSRWYTTLDTFSSSFNDVKFLTKRALNRFLLAQSSFQDLVNAKTSVAEHCTNN